MIFHTPDPSFFTLIAMCKRCASFAAAGKIDSDHPLAAAWSNVKLMNSAWTRPQAVFLGDCLYPALSFESIQMALDMRYLDWFAEKVDCHATHFLLTGDDSFAAICHEWARALWFIPPGLPKAVVAKIQEIRS